MQMQPNKLLGVIGEHEGYPVEHMDVSYDKTYLWLVPLLLHLLSPPPASILLILSQPLLPSLHVSCCQDASARDPLAGCMRVHHMHRCMCFSVLAGVVCLPPLPASCTCVRASGM